MRKYGSARFERKGYKMEVAICDLQSVQSCDLQNVGGLDGRAFATVHGRRRPRTLSGAAGRACGAVFWKNGSRLSGLPATTRCCRPNVPGTGGCAAKSSRPKCIWPICCPHVSKCCRMQDYKLHSQGLTNSPGLKINLDLSPRISGGLVELRACTQFGQSLFDHVIHPLDNSGGGSAKDFTECECRNVQHRANEQDASHGLDCTHREAAFYIHCTISSTDFRPRVAPASGTGSAG